MRVPLLVLGLLVVAGSASAGSRDAPEVSDPEGDCQYALGNEYADIVAAWISDETASDFRVNIALAKWAPDTLASYAGYTLQFTHQSVDWGVAAFFDPQRGWQWSTATLDRETGEMSSFAETLGEWDADTTTMKIVFPKSIFPHDGNDNALRGFLGGAADFKKDVPVFVARSLGAPVAPVGDLMTCDLIQSNATYTFTVGEHTMHTMSAASDAAAATNASQEEASAAAGPGGAPSSAPAPRETPYPFALGLVALACLAALRRAP
ncbi:MAG TPA: hypothetical protein VFH78_10255 [Candidatus Thermoplasmatota archaeon]|nr:hypothetical protein [Candidatus Thermoplasmatota archaeon]